MPFSRKIVFQNKKLPFGRKYQTFGVKVYFFVFRYVGTRNFFRHIESCSIEFYRVVMFILYISWPQSLAILLFKSPFSFFSSTQNKKFCSLSKSLGCSARMGHFWPQNMLSWAHIGLAGSFGVLLVGWLVVSRKTPIDFMCTCVFVCLCIWVMYL